MFESETKSKKQVKPTEAEKAVENIVQRTIRDRDFSWLMMGTESLHLCVVAHAKRLSISAQHLNDLIAQKMERRNEELESVSAEIVLLRKRLELVAEEIEAMHSVGEIPEAYYKSVRTILDGRSETEKHLKRNP